MFKVNDEAVVFTGMQLKLVLKVTGSGRVQTWEYILLSVLALIFIRPGYRLTNRDSCS